MILLHHCCVVCTPKVLEFLRNEFKQVTGFWYNPNIMPEEEHTKRLDALKMYAENKNHSVIIERDEILPPPQRGQNDIVENNWWLEEANRVQEAGQDRCEFCYYVRLKRSSRTAKEKGFKKFTTTLLSSHHQKHELIKSMGELAAKEDGIEFYYKDFRPFFYEGRNEVYKRGLYMQKYCGCHFSLEGKNEI